MKWLILVLCLVSPCFGATLSGVVKNNADGLAVNRARVFVFHELALFLVQKGFSDRNGQYFFNLEPGPYRIWVLKEGYLPERISALVTDMESKKPIEHRLFRLSEDQRPSGLRTEIRKKKNREPFKSLSQPVLSAQMMLQQDLQNLAGSVRSRSLKDLNGATGRRDTVEVETRLTEQIRLHSTVASEQREHLPDNSVRMKAGVGLEVSGLELDVSGESIQMPDYDSSMGSRALSVSGSYNKLFHTSLGYVVSEDPDNQHQALSLVQDATYMLPNQQPLFQKVSLENWQQDGSTTAQHASIRTDWKYRPHSVLGLRSDLEHFSTPEESITAGKVFVTGERSWNNLSVVSRVGLHHREEKEELVQQHRVRSTFNSSYVEAEYDEDCNFHAYRSHDVFGSYLPQPLTPYSQESFYYNRIRKAHLLVGFEHGTRWNSNLGWTHRREEAELLTTGIKNTYADEAEVRQEAYTYSLSSDYWGARVEISHSRNAGEGNEFDRTGLSFVQSLNPFRKKNLGVLLELQMTNHPDLPAWWLLNQMPWDPNEDQTWYQGNLSLQF